jgi:hypothetical protein
MYPPRLNRNFNNFDERYHLSYVKFHHFFNAGGVCLPLRLLLEIKGSRNGSSEFPDRRGIPSPEDRALFLPSKISWMRENNLQE